MLHIADGELGAKRLGVLFLRGRVLVMGELEKMLQAPGIQGKKQPSWEEGPLLLKEILLSQLFTVDSTTVTSHQEEACTYNGRGKQVTSYDHAI